MYVFVCLMYRFLANMYRDNKYILYAIDLVFYSQMGKSGIKKSNTFKKQSTIKQFQRANTFMNSKKAATGGADMSQLN